MIDVAELSRFWRRLWAPIAFAIRLDHAAKYARHLVDESSISHPVEVHRYMFDDQVGRVDLRVLFDEMTESQQSLTIRIHDPIFVIDAQIRALVNAAELYEFNYLQNT